MLSKDTQKLLRCPICNNNLSYMDKYFICSRQKCKKKFPTINNIPILINEKNSLFDINSFLNGKETTIALQRESKLIQLSRLILPTIGLNFKSKKNYELLASLLKEKRNKKIRMLVLGGRTLGKGMDLFLDQDNIELIESDVTLGPRTNIIIDAHDIPFAENSIDCVIIQAVLEHVLDPFRVVDEIYRVLKADGLLYSEIPFMQQVHQAPFDFTRFTYLGQKRLFRKFNEIKSGVIGGPGMALAWSYKYFLMSFTKSQFLKKIIREFAHLTSFYLKYFDYFLIDRPGSYDAASGFYFLGMKAKTVLNDKLLTNQFKGLG